MSATGPWLCLTDPDDIKRVFTAEHRNVLRFGAAVAKIAPHPLLLGPTGLPLLTVRSTRASAGCSCRHFTVRCWLATRR